MRQLIESRLATFIIWLLAPFLLLILGGFWLYDQFTNKPTQP